MTHGDEAWCGRKPGTLNRFSKGSSQKPANRAHFGRLPAQVMRDQSLAHGSE